MASRDGSRHLGRRKGRPERPPSRDGPGRVVSRDGSDGVLGGSPPSREGRGVSRDTKHHLGTPRPSQEGTSRDATGLYLRTNHPPEIPKFISGEYKCLRDVRYDSNASLPSRHRAKGTTCYLPFIRNTWDGRTSGTRPRTRTPPVGRPPPQPPPASRKPPSPSTPHRRQRPLISAAATKGATAEAAIVDITEEHLTSMLENVQADDLLGTLGDLIGAGAGDPAGAAEDSAPRRWSRRGRSLRGRRPERPGQRRRTQQASGGLQCPKPQRTSSIGQTQPTAKRAAQLLRRLQISVPRKANRRNTSLSRTAEAATSAACPVTARPWRTSSVCFWRVVDAGVTHQLHGSAPKW